MIPFCGALCIRWQSYKCAVLFVVLSADVFKSDDEKVELRLIFTEKRQIETNDKTTETKHPVSGSGEKKAGRKRKSEKTVEKAPSPGKRNVLEEFKEKCGVGLSQERISSLKLMTHIPLEHNYFVHESAKLLKIKLTQAQVVIIPI